MVEIAQFKPMNRNSLIGFVNVSIPSWRIQINDIAIFQKGDSRWLQMPSKRFEGTGKASYQPMVEWGDKAVLERFRKAVFQALEAGGYVPVKGDSLKMRYQGWNFKPADYPEIPGDDIKY